MLSEKCDDDDDDVDDEFPINTKTHYCWIKDLSALVGKQIPLAHKKKTFCDRCLNYFMNVEKLQEHLRHCAIQNDYQIQMPSFENNIIEYKNVRNQLIVPYVVYADTESILQPPDKQFSNTGNAKAYQEHKVHSIGFYVKCSFHDTQSYYKSKRGPDCTQWFAREMYKLALKVDCVLQNPKPLQMSDDDEVIFIMADKCHICGGKFRDDDVKVRDHCHLTGQFRDAAHQKCNLDSSNPHSHAQFNALRCAFPHQCCGQRCPWIDINYSNHRPKLHLIHINNSELV